MREGQLTGNLPINDSLLQPGYLSVRRSLPFVATSHLKPPPDSAPIAPTQGSPSELRVEVTGMRLYPDLPDESSIYFLVVRAHNLPQIERWLRLKRSFFVTVSDQATTRKSASAWIDGETVEWNEKLDALWDIPYNPMLLAENPA